MKRILQLFFLFLVLAIALPAYAAKQVSGEVPQVQPLLPAPQGIAPNVSKNVQFHDPSHDGQFDASGTPVNGNQSDASQPEVAQATSAGPNQLDGPSGWVLAVIVAVGLLAWLVFWYKNRKSQS